MEYELLARELDGAQSGEAETASPRESRDWGDEDGARRDFWEEVRTEARAMMREQLEEAKEAARRAGLEAAQAEIQQLHQELADSEAEAQDLRDELEASQRELVEARSASMGSQRLEAQERGAEKREIAALQAMRDQAQADNAKLIEQVRLLHSELRTTKNELEGFSKRAVHAEGIVYKCKENQRLAEEARESALADTERVKEERKAAMKGAKAAEAQRTEAEATARAAVRKAEVVEANGAYLRTENARLKAEVKELRSRVEQMAFDKPKEGGNFGRQSVVAATQSPLPQQSMGGSHGNAELAQQQQPREQEQNGFSGGKESRASRPSSNGSVNGSMQQQKLSALLEQSIELWNDMHAVADALEEAERAAGAGKPRPASVERVLHSISRWSDPPRVAVLSIPFQSDSALAGEGERVTLPQLRPECGQGAAASTPSSRPSHSGKSLANAAKPIGGAERASWRVGNNIKRIYSLRSDSTVKPLAAQLAGSSETFGLGALLCKTQRKQSSR